MLRVVRKFFALPIRKKCGVLSAWIVLILVRIGLWCLPFPRLLKLVAFLSGKRPVDRPPSADADDIAWAVNAASRFVPKPTCFTRALALNALLSRHGLASQIKIGIAKDANGGLKSHAWVEYDGRVIIGYLTDLSDFSAFVSLDRAANLLGRGSSL